MAEDESGNDTGTESESESETETIDVSVYEAKIAELTATIESMTADLATAANALNVAKAANWDLLQQMPKDEGSDDVETDTAEPSADPTDDLFEEKD